MATGGHSLFSKVYRYREIAHSGRKPWATVRAISSPAFFNQYKDTMAIVNYPILRFKSSLENFLRFTKEYNSDKPLKEQLRPQHIKMFTRILTLLSRQLYEHNRLFKDTPVFRQLDTGHPVVLYTNRKALSWVEKVVKINEHSAYRHVNRLMEAGAVTRKVNHGSQMNFELWINPEILLITEFSEDENETVPEDPENGNKAVSEEERTNCEPEYLIPEKELFNNSTITVKKVSLPAVRDGLSKEQERTQKKNFLKEHREISQNPDDTGKKINERSAGLIQNWNKKEQEIPPRRETKLREYQKAAARWFFWYVLTRLFEGRVFNPAHLENTLAYVEQYYFVNCHTLNAIENTRKLYQWRIDKARGTIDRHNTDMRWVFPGYYLDLNRSGTNPKTGKPYLSFANTASWPSKYFEFRKAKEKQRKENTGRDFLDKQLRLYLNNPSIEQYKRCEAYVKKNIPHLMPDFLGHFTTPKTYAHA